MQALVERFDIPVSVDTWNPIVLLESAKVGAVLGNDISGFANRQYLEVAADHNIGVVATHIRLAPRVPDLNPIYEDLVVDVRNFLVERAKWAIESGVDPRSVIIDAGLDLGKTAVQSLELLRKSTLLTQLGYPVLLSASNKDFLGSHLDLDLSERRAASISAALIAFNGGARIFRVHDVKGHRRALDMMAELSSRVPTHLNPGSHVEESR